MHNRSTQLKAFLIDFFQRQDKIYHAALQRRSNYIQQAYGSGLDKRHLDVIEELYFSRSSGEERLEIAGGYADDL